MCKELDEELQRGNDAFRAVAQHMANMGADSTSDEITVETPRGTRLTYRITAELA
jgi:hypothetical protein